jgi:hypothetical protein
MGMRDNRLNKIVFVSLCILNQNVRFPGIAVEQGACTELVDMLMGYGLGIEPLPCLERLGWGGVSRKAYFRYQPIMLRYADLPFSGFLRIFARLWVFRYSLLCRSEARKVAANIQDYLSASYSVIGIIAMNDSPTDGVTRTIDLIKAPKRFKDMGFSEKMLKAPDISIMKGIINDLCEPGTGIFISRLRKELEKKGIQIKIIGFDPWADRTEECMRIEHELGLHAGH